MTMLTICSILLTALCVGAVIWKRRGLPESVSAMVYDLPRGGWQWLWTIWVWAVGFTLFPALFEAMPERWGAVAYAFAASLLSVGAMPVMRGVRNAAHDILGVSAGVFSQLCVTIISPWWLLAWVPMVMLIAACTLRADGSSCIPPLLEGKGITLAELLCGISLYGSLLTYLMCHG